MVPSEKIQFNSFFSPIFIKYVPVTRLAVLAKKRTNFLKLKFYRCTDLHALISSVDSSLRAESPSGAHS